ncbi:MAG: flippase [Sphingobacterium sp.]|jgi:PST family polysaccharide transporter|nr:flippase [Sphingobacterium sp.]
MNLFKDKILQKNFSYLFLLQIANYIIPLFLFPYLGRVLGTENFGKIMFAQAVVAYFVLFTDFGFNVSSTKEITDAMGDKEKASETFWNTMLAKTLLLFISLIVFFPVVYGFDKFRGEHLLFVISFLNVFSSVLLPLWLFQGLEKMGLIVIVNTIPRILMCVATIYFVKSSTDYNLALFIQVLANFVSALLSIIIVFKLKLVIFSKPSLERAKIQIKNGWHIFATSLSSNLYTTTNTVVLGLLVGNNAVGIYSASDKIVRALIGLLSSITQVVFPRVNVYYNESKQKSISFIKQILLLMSIACLIVGFGLYFFANDIIMLLFKESDFQRSIKVLQFSSLLPLFSVVNGLLAVNVFITFGLKRQLLKIVFVGCVFSLIFISPLVINFKEIGAILCATLTEILIFILFIYYIIRNKIVNYE